MPIKLNSIVSLSKFIPGMAKILLDQFYMRLANKIYSV